MKIGMNLLLWTDHVTEAQDAILDQIKESGLRRGRGPDLQHDRPDALRAAGQAAQEPGAGGDGRHGDGAALNPISPDPKVRDAAVAHLDRVMECGQQFGCEILCGPLHSAIGVFSGTGPTEDEFKYGVETLQQRRREGRGARDQAGARVPQPVRDLLPDDRRPDRSRSCRR